MSYSPCDHKELDLTEWLTYSRVIKHFLEEFYYENTEGLHFGAGLNLLFLVNKTGAKATGEMGKGEKLYPEV